MAAAIALAAAVGEARGARIVPQVRRQVPESWRRRLPLPLAAGLYGVLLGLGFTTFILTFAVWALAGVSVAVGDPALGVAVGLAFGAGRLLPVVVLAPGGAHRAPAPPRTRRWPSARRSCARCAPSTRSRWRRARSCWWPDAMAAETCWRPHASDPSVDGGARRLARRRRGRASSSAAAPQRGCPARIPRSAAAGSPCSTDGAIVVRRPPGRRSPPTVPAPGADALAVSRRVAGLAGARAATGDAIYAAPLAGGEPRLVDARGRARPPGARGRPARLPRGRPHGSRIVIVDLATGTRPPCAASGARCCSTRRCTAAGCSTSARSTSARSCASGRRPRARRGATAGCGRPCRPAAATPATSRARSTTATG